MDKIKFKVTCQWCSDIDVYNRFIRNYITSENYDTNVQITYQDDYDYLIVFNRNRFNPQIKCPKSNVIGFIMEPSWSGSWDRNIGTYCGRVYFHDVWLLDNNTPFIENFISHPAMMLYHMSKDPVNKYLRGPLFPKSKKMSYIVSYGQPDNDKHVLYGQRAKLANKILESNLPIDIYGRGWNANHLDKRIKGPIDNKADGLIDYQYSIAVENSSEKNYLTEKFIDCILCNNVPIYFGCPNAHQIYDQNCFIDLNLFSDNVITQIGDVLSNDDYAKRVDSLINAKLSYYKNYNIYEMVKGYVR